MISPVLAVHADWSVDPRKRWMAVAQRDGQGWGISAPCPVGAVDTLLDRLRQQARGSPVALGLDLPLGVPRAYAAGLEEPDFPAFLRALAGRPAFFDVCETLAEISEHRPFYPRHGLAGMTRAAHAAALGFADAGGLSRACDRATADRPAGAPLFWTLGANQTGKAAICGWRDLLLPAFSRGLPVRLWPFDGDFRALLAPGGVAIAETYPAEALRQLGLRMPGSKRRQTDRAALGPALLGVCDARGIGTEPALRAAILDGFGRDAAGEDRLDCVLGALCVIGVLDGRRPDDTPPDPWLRRWEGWVLGQRATSQEGAAA